MVQKRDHVEPHAIDDRKEAVLLYPVRLEVTVRITSKGQVTIPQDIREAAGLLPNTEVEFKYDGDVVSIVKAADAKRATRGARIVENLRTHGKGVRMTTDELMALTRGEP